MTGPAVKSEAQDTQQTQQTSSWFASFSHIGRALRHRNFRLFYFGQSISVIGTWMTRIATVWLVTSDAFGSAARRRELFGQIAGVCPRPVRRRVGRALESPQAPGVDASRRRRSIARAGRAHARSRHHSLGNHRARRAARRDQRVRHARPPILPGANGRGSQRPEQRHRDQLFDGQRLRASSARRSPAS